MKKASLLKKEKPKAKPQKLTTDRDSLAECLHVALRKCCDSTPTSLLWNLIYIMDSGMWGRYLDYVWMRLQVAEVTGEPLWMAVKTASMGFDEEIFKSRDPRIEGHSVTLMRIVFEMFDQSDWEGYASFLHEEED